MAKKGRIGIYELGNSVFDYIKDTIKDKIDTHNHDVFNLDRIEEIATKKDLNDLAGTSHNHEISHVYELQGELDNRAILNHEHTLEEMSPDFIVNINTIKKSFIYCNNTNLSNIVNCEINEIDDPEVCGKIIYNESTADNYNIVFNIPKDQICLGTMTYRIRFKIIGDITNQKPKIRIQSVKSFDTQVEDRVLGVSLDMELDLTDATVMKYIYGVFDMKLFSKDSIGINIYLHHNNKTSVYQLILDEIIISPAFPGIYIN